MRNIKYWGMGKIVENEDPAKDKSFSMEGVEESASHKYASSR